MSARIQVLADPGDKARWREQAAREGKSLGAWIREAAEEKYVASRGRCRLRTVSDLQRFFAECDAMEGEGAEPEWEEHKRVIEGAGPGGYGGYGGQ